MFIYLLWHILCITLYMNRFLLRGILILVVGVLLNVLGFQLKDAELGPYSWAMIIGTLMFGIGFMNIFYSFVRKVEYKGLVDERADEAVKRAEREATVQNFTEDKVRKAS